jgi:hypothetical protein
MNVIIVERLAILLEIVQLQATAPAPTPATLIILNRLMVELLSDHNVIHVAGLDISQENVEMDKNVIIVENMVI